MDGIGGPAVFRQYTKGGFGGRMEDDDPRMILLKKCPETSRRRKFHAWADIKLCSRFSKGTEEKAKMMGEFVVRRLILL